MGEEVYESDPEPAPDAEFVRGELAYAVAGNRGRLLDARRTPLSLTDVVPERGEFRVRIEAFEDRGALWRLPLWEIGRMQFANDSARAPGDVVARLEQAAKRFARELVVEARTDALAQTRRRIDEYRASARGLLGEFAGSIELAASVDHREGDERLYLALERLMVEHDLAELDHSFTRVMVSNPRSGELVKGHAIVLAELGLCPFVGNVIRDPALFAGDQSRARRAEHLIARIAFTQELWNNVIAQPLTLYRAAAADGLLHARDPASFVSCTFSEPVAAAHFAGGPTTQMAVMWRQVVDPNRLLMTFLETVEMSDGFKEAEAVLIADPTNPAF
jgi:hypothetical protein